MLTSIVLMARRMLQILVLASVGLWALPASAAGLGAKEQQDIVDVVRGQLNAFSQDDAAKAFSYAAPNIQKMVGNAENFMQMVRTSYQVVYRPASTSFMQPVGHAGNALLKVRMTDADSGNWEALYTLQKQGNKVWRITGCVVTEASGTMI